MKAPRIDSELARWLRTFLLLAALLWMVRMHVDIRTMQADRFTSLDADIKTAQLELGHEALRVDISARIAELAAQLDRIEQRIDGQ